MSSDYKLRLPDGSEIGPLSLDDVKGWYARGLVGPDDMVFKPGSGRWVPLRQVMPADALRPISSAGSASSELRAAARAAVKPRTPASAGSRGKPVADEVEVEVQRWRTVLVGALLLVVAAGAGALVFLPERWLPALDDAPWREIALGALALGLLLVRGWELARKIVRVVLLIAAAALFPVVGILVAQGVRGAGLIVVAAALVLLAGLVVSLAGGWLPWWRVAAGLVLVLAGVAGIVRFGLVSESPQAAQVRAWAQPERRFQDAARGARLELPPGWVALKPEQTLVAPAPGIWLVLAHPREGGLALVSAESLPATPAEDVFLTRVVARRKLEARTPLERSDVTLGALRGRQETSRFEQSGAPWSDLTAVAKDGRTYWVLSAWLPDDGSSRPARELQALASGLTLDGRAASQLASAVRAAIDDAPWLTSAAAEQAIASAPGPTLDPAQTFRRAVLLAEHGRAHLAAGELQEFEELNTSACALLPKAERERLLAYLERVRSDQAAGTDDDRAMSTLMKRAVLGLAPAARGARLQVLYEKAIRAAVAALDKS